MSVLLVLGGIILAAVIAYVIIVLIANNQESTEKKIYGYLRNCVCIPGPTQRTVEVTEFVHKNLSRIANATFIIKCGPDIKNTLIESECNNVSIRIVDDFIEGTIRLPGGGNNIMSFTITNTKMSNLGNRIKNMVESGLFANLNRTQQ